MNNLNNQQLINNKTNQVDKYHQHNWYGIYTKPRFERKLHNALREAKYKAFLPMIKEKRIWSDRIKTLHVPLLPSYVFVKVRKIDFPQIYLFSGFIRFVSFGGKPYVIKDTEIELLEKVVNNGFHVQRTTCLCEVGDWVRVMRGPLKGWEGRVEGKHANSRIVFLLESIDEALSVDIDVGNVKRIRKKCSREVKPKTTITFN